MLPSFLLAACPCECRRELVMLVVFLLLGYLRDGIYPVQWALMFSMAHAPQCILHGTRSVEHGPWPGMLAQAETDALQRKEQQLLLQRGFSAAHGRCAEKRESHFILIVCNYSTVYPFSPPGASLSP